MSLSKKIATYKDIDEAGGIISISASKNKNICVRADEIDRFSATLWLPTFCNVTSNTTYESANQMVTFDSLDIAETGTIYLGVNYLNTYSNYTIDGVTVNVVYPNGSRKTHVISVYNATGSIPIENCVIGAKVSINTDTLSGAYVRLDSNTKGRITLNSAFTSGGEVTVNHFLGSYPCFTITKKSSGGFEPVYPDPGIGDITGGTVTATTTRTIDVILNNITSNINNITIGTSTYATGTTSTNFGSTSNMNIRDVAYQSTIPIGKFAGATLTVPKNAYVQINMGPISYSRNNLSLKAGVWDSATKVVYPGETSVEFLFNPGSIEK